MQWEAGPKAGFTTGESWLPLVDPAARNVADELAEPGSLLSLYRRLLELRRGLGAGFRLLDAEPGVVAYERDGYAVAVNTTAEPRTAPKGERVLATHDGDDLPPHAALIVRN
jgi:alpha-glucosidase